MVYEDAAKFAKVILRHIKAGRSIDIIASSKPEELIHSVRPVRVKAILERKSVLVYFRRDNDGVWGTRGKIIDMFGGDQPAVPEEFVLKGNFRVTNYPSAQEYDLTDAGVTWSNLDYVRGMIGVRGMIRVRQRPVNGNGHFGLLVCAPINRPPALISDNLEVINVPEQVDVALADWAVTHGVDNGKITSADKARESAAIQAYAHDIVGDPAVVRENIDPGGARVLDRMDLPGRHGGEHFFGPGALAADRHLVGSASAQQLVIDANVPIRNVLGLKPGDEVHTLCIHDRDGSTRLVQLVVGKVSTIPGFTEIVAHAG